MNLGFRIFTGRYSNPHVATSGLSPIGITRYPPRFSLPYEIKANLYELAPTSAMLAGVKEGTLSPQRFATDYAARLATLSLPALTTILRCLQGEGPGVVLLCYEDLTAGESCHRTILGDWLRERGIDVVELFDPGKKKSKSAFATGRGNTGR